MINGYADGGEGFKDGGPVELVPDCEMLVRHALRLFGPLSRPRFPYEVVD